MSDLMKQALASCTPEDKRELLAELASEWFQSSTDGDFTLRNASAETVGYFFPNAEGWNAFDTAHRDEVRRRVANPGRQMSLEEFIREADADAAKSKRRNT